MDEEDRPGLARLPGVMAPYGRPLLLIAHPDDEAVGATALLGALEGWAVLLLTDGAPRDPRLRALPRLSREAYAATHPYEGGHPDHDAAAFIAQEACALAAARGQRPPPRLEFACYHPSGERLVTGRFLPGGPRAIELSLSGADRERKRAMLAAHQSQREVLSAFSLEIERYRPAPLYDFSQRPHPGPNRAEVLGWPLTGDRFCQLAREAAGALGISEVTWA